MSAFWLEKRVVHSLIKHLKGWALGACLARKWPHNHSNWKTGQV